MDSCSSNGDVDAELEQLVNVLPSNKAESAGGGEGEMHGRPTPGSDAG